MTFQQVAVVSGQDGGVCLHQPGINVHLVRRTMDVGVLSAGMRQKGSGDLVNLNFSEQPGKSILSWLRNPRRSLLE